VVLRRERCLASARGGAARILLWLMQADEAIRMLKAG